MFSGSFSTTKRFEVQEQLRGEVVGKEGSGWGGGGLQATDKFSLSYLSEARLKESPVKP